MSWFTRIFGSAKPATSIHRMNAIREAIAADGDDTGALESLLKPPFDLNTPEGDPVFPIVLAGDGMMIINHGTFPLILAAMLHKPNRARLLLKHGARASVTCAHGRTPLHWAILGAADSSLLNAHEVASKDAAANQTPQPPLGQIGSEDQAASLATTVALLEHGADPNIPDALGQTPVFRACSVGGKTEHLKLLLQRGADVNACSRVGDTPLVIASQRSLEDMVAALLDAGADPNRRSLAGATALHWACARASLPIARRLLAARADANARDREGVTPLSIAAGLNQTELVQALRDAGATHMPPPGFPPPAPLIVAAANGDLPAVQLLLQRGEVALEATTADGWTALHEAVAHGPELTGLLLAAGANANASSDAGYTPLHRAAAKGQADVMKLLVAHGANVSATDARGNALEQFALASGDPRTIATVAELRTNAAHPRSASES